MIHEFRDGAGGIATELDTVAIQPDDREGRALIGTQLVQLLERNLERELALGIVSDDMP